MADVLTCTFCRKSEHEIRKLVAGPGVYICDECIEIAHHIVSETPNPPRAARWRRAVAHLGQLLTSVARKFVRSVRLQADFPGPAQAGHHDAGVTTPA